MPDLSGDESPAFDKGGGDVAVRLTIQGDLPGRKAQEEMAAEKRKLALAKDIPAKARDAAVMALLTPANEGRSREALLDWPVLLIRRNTYPGVHSGQIALPGGKREKKDAGLWDTACREVCEEVGLGKSAYARSGALSALYVPASNFVIYPFVSMRTTDTGPRADPREVAECKNAPLRVFDPDRAVTMNFPMRTGEERPVPAWRYENFVVWGATAMILAELYRLVASEVLVRTE